MKIHTIEQGTDEWKALRAGKVTGSCFAKVLAKIKSGEAAERRNYRTDLVIERLTGSPLQGFVTPAMRQGTEREPMARLAYEAETGNVVEQVGFCEHDEIAAGVSPDGLIGSDGGVECKCPERSNHLAYIRMDTPPPEYVAQIQGNMWITGRQWWDFVSYNPDFPEHLQLVVRRVQRHEPYIKELEDEVRKFLTEVDAEVEALQRRAA